MSNNKIYRVLESLLFTASLASASLAANDLYFAGERAKEVYLDNESDSVKGLNQSKKYGTIELGIAALLATGAIIARSKTRGRSRFEVLEGLCLAGALSISYFSVADLPFVPATAIPDHLSKDLLNTRNAFAIKGYLPMYRTCTKKEKRLASRIIKQRTPYLGLELLGMSAFLYLATKKEK